MKQIAVTVIGIVSCQAGKEAHMISKKLGRRSFLTEKEKVAMSTSTRFISIFTVVLAIAVLIDLGHAIPVLAKGSTVTVINATDNPVPITVQRTLVYDGTYFSVTKPADSDPTLTVPAGVVLTDAHITFSVPGNNPNAASLSIRVGSKTIVYQIVNDTTFHAGISLGSGIESNGDVTVQLSCYNIAGNHCQGAIMWSGYRP